MKKLIFSALAAIGLLLSPSCSDENEVLSGSDNEALVSFNVNLADGIQTKADPTTTTLGNGTKAKNLVVDVFEKNTSGEYVKIDGLRYTKDNTFTDLSTTVNFNLVKGKTYRLIFWAQAQSVVNSTNSPYDISNLSQIKVNYAAGITDDEDRDAFLGVTDPITVNANFNQTVELHRPFAQLNYLIDKAEYDAAVAAGMEIQKAKVTVAKVAKILRPLTKTVSDFAENVTFEVTDIPTDFANLSTEDYLTLPKVGSTSGETEKYYYLASKYFLVAAGNEATNSALEQQATLATTSFKLVNSSDQEIADYEFKVPAVPVQWNYRTNIYGNLITSQGNFTVNIVPGFNTPDNNLPQSTALVNNANEIVAAIENGATTIVASENFELSDNSVDPTTIIVPRNYTAENNGVELTFDLSKATVTNNGIAEIKISYKSGDSQHGPENVNVIASGNITIELPDSHVTLNGAEVPGGTTYNTVTASTSGTTLVVPNGVTVENLNVMAGNVRIEKGGTVKNITNGTSGEITVDLEEGGILENIPDDLTKIIVRRSISTAEGLVAFAEAVNGGNTYAGQTVVLSADIDLKNANWTPIGLNADENNKFKGTFDGQGYTISNLSIDMPEAACVGLFGKLLSPGKIQNVKIENASVKGQSQVGALVGSAYTGTVSDCVISGNVKIEGNYQVGGLTGYGYAAISDCSVTGNSDSYVKGVHKQKDLEGDAVGGIIGYYAEGEKTLENCSASINVEGTRKVGGLAGQVGYGITVSGTFTGTVSTNADKNYISTNASKIMVGGIVGEMTGSEGKTNTITINATITSGSIVKGVDPTTTGLIIGGSRTPDATLDISSSISEGAILMIPIAPGLTLVNGDYEISNADGLKAFEKQVNEGHNNYSGKKVVLSNDIDLNNEAWTPVGQTGATQFSGTFDGRDHTISNLKINNTDQGGDCSTGLFGWLNSAIVKNIKVNHADVTGYHNVGVIAGYLETSGCTIENCHVTDATISCTSVNGEANGDKCGGIVGHAGNAGVKVSGCKVTNSTISAGRDAGQVVGAAKETNVTGCSADNVTVTANGSSTGDNIKNEVIGRVL